MGVISEVVPTFSHKNPYSYKAIAYSTLGIAFVGFPHVGPPHVRRRDVGLRRRRVRRALDARRDLLRHQGVHLGAHDAKGLDRRANAAPLLLRVPLPLRLRRDDRRRGRDPEPRRPLARHLLRRRPLPLHHGGRHADRVARRGPLLVSEDDRPHVPRALGLPQRGAHLRGLLPDVLSAVSARQRRDAAPLLQLRSAVPVAARHLDGGLVAPRRRHDVHARLPRRRALHRTARAGQPVGLAQLRVADAVAAAEAQLRAASPCSSSAPTTTRQRLPEERGADGSRLESPSRRALPGSDATGPRGAARHVGVPRAARCSSSPVSSRSTRPTASSTRWASARACCTTPWRWDRPTRRCCS